MNHIPVRSGVEGDELLFGDAGVEQYGEMKQVPKRRHGAQFAFGEQLAKLSFGGQPNIGIVQEVPERIKVDQVVGRKHCQTIALGASVDHSLGQFVWRYMFGESDLQRREGKGVLRVGLADVSVI